LGESFIEEVIVEVGTSKHVILTGVPVVSEEHRVERVKLRHIIGLVGVAQVKCAKVVVGILVRHKGVVRVRCRVDVVCVLEVGLLIGVVWLVLVERAAM
jgi:hypothetical protein